MASFEDQIQRFVERRLQGLGFEPEPLDDDALHARYGRAPGPAGTRHFTIEIGGQPCAYSVLAAPAGQESAVQAEANNAVGDLRAAGRQAVGNVDVIGGLGSVYTDLVAAEDAGPVDPAALERTLTAVFATDEVHQLIREGGEG